MCKIIMVIYMKNKLLLNTLPEYKYSGFKNFSVGEKHVTRICNEDVLILMLDGELSFREDGKDILLCKGQYYIQKRGLLQEGIESSDNAEYYYIHFIGEYGDNGLDLKGEDDFYNYIKLFEKLNFLQLAKGSRIEISAIFYEILSRLINYEKDKNENNTVLKIIQKVSNNLAHNYTLDELSEIFGYSKNHIINIFKKEVDSTPYAYFLNVRINAAKRLLSDSNQSVNLISEEVGFTSYINFYKQFVKETGYSPLEWRNKERKQHK